MQLRFSHIIMMFSNTFLASANIISQRNKIFVMDNCFNNCCTHCPFFFGGGGWSMGGFYYTLLNGSLNHILFYAGGRDDDMESSFFGVEVGSEISADDKSWCVDVPVKGKPFSKLSHTFG